MFVVLLDQITSSTNLFSTEIIMSARQTVLSDVVVATAGQLHTWTQLCRNQPCENRTCNSSSIAALEEFFLRSGLSPGSKLDEMSLHDVVTALKIITVPDAAAHGYDNGKLDWAALIRETHNGTCTLCGPNYGTNFLFPLECLLSNITWRLHDKIYAATDYPQE